MTAPTPPDALDASLCDCGDGYPSYGIGKAKHLPSCHYGIIADWLDERPPTPPDALREAARAVVDAYMGPDEFGLLREAHILALRAALAQPKEARDAE
jgi:hypothetical protein